MNEKNAGILENIVEAYIDEAFPIGSKYLVEKYRLSMSSATVRNQMMELEQDGYLTHPHTSAGRIPTEKAYRYYVRHCVGGAALAEKEQQQIRERTDDADDARAALKELAKAVAEIARLAVLVGFTPRDVYYTGLSYLFSQPEFSHVADVTTLSRVLDHLDETMERLAGESEQSSVLIGEDNPFGTIASAIIVRQETENGVSIFTILGPQRMRYRENIALAHFARTIIQNYSDGRTDTE